MYNSSGQELKQRLQLYVAIKGSIQILKTEIHLLLFTGHFSLNYPCRREQQQNSINEVCYLDTLCKLSKIVFKMHTIHWDNYAIVKNQV